MVVYHRLINRNIETRQATCMVCGPVAVLRTGTKEKPQWVCAKYVRYFRLRKWGMSVDEYQRMLDAQGGLCAICKEEMGLPQIDHSHHGNMGIRELLCRRCNFTLGNVKDSIPLLVQMILYLKKHKE